MVEKVAKTTLRALNRATLARQALLAREKSALRVIERLVGLQAQWPKPPFIGLFSRVASFERGDLLRLVRARKVVRASMMRGTLHFASAKDFLRLRLALQPVFTRGLDRILRDRAPGLDVNALVEAARAYFLEEPRTFGELRDFLVTIHPKVNERAMGFAVRMTLPLVQVPHERASPSAGGASEASWGYPADADFAVAESWLGQAPAPAGDPSEIVGRYLAAFGPATVGDAQAWSGLQGLAPAFERLRPKLVTLRDERGRELFDLPDAPRPVEDTPAPVRFLPEFDNLIVSRTDARFVPLAHRKRVFLSALRVRATFLVDGLAAGTWSVARKGGNAILTLEQFEALGKKVRAEVEAEGEAVARFVEEGAKGVDVKIS
jgi:Winged helix DNA-binding domain